MAVSKNNALKIVWFTAGEAGKPGLYEAESIDFGTTFSERILISEGDISGTPIFSTGDSGKSKLLWESDGKLYQSNSAANRDFTKAQTISDGNLPSAVAFGEKFFVAYIKKENEKRAVWLAEF